jgi:hypothetical protein
MISEKELREFKDIYREVHGEEINNQEALEMANRLINLYKIILFEDNNRSKE